MAAVWTDANGVVQTEKSPNALALNRNTVNPQILQQQISANAPLGAAGAAGASGASGAASSTIFDNFWDALSNLNVGSTLGGLLSGAGYYNLMNDLKSFGQQAQTSAESIGTTAAQDTRFVPFTVTGATGGNIATTSEGSTTMTLSPEEQAIQDMLFGGASQFYQQAQQPIAQTEQDIYNRMLQVAAPERERQQLALEERLAAQGRLGTSSAAYGGATPEQMALATAQQEQLNQLGLQARNQALAEQQQAAGLGQGMLGAAYMPQSNLLNILQGGLGTAGLADVARRQAAQIEAEAGMGGLDAYLQAMLGRGNLGAQGIAGLAALLGGQKKGEGLFGDLDLGKLFGF